MGLRTIILKLHKPSQAKKLILDKAFVNYNNALAFLLEKAHPHLTEIKEHCRGRGGSFSILSLSKWVDAAMSRELNKFGVQPFKDSLRLEFATLLAGYIKRQETMPDLEYPRVRTGSYSHSIYFCRYDTKRNCCLLFDEVTKRYYAKLYLMNNAHARVRKDVSSAGAGLMHVAKDRRVLERNRKKEAYLVCPLDFGRWQEDMLKEAANAPESFKTARLFKRGQDYYLALTLAWGAETPIPVKTFMGISRGIKNRLYYTVVDQNGLVMAHGAGDSIRSDESAKKQRLSEPGGESLSQQELHIITNSLVKLALKYESQVILQNLAHKGDRLSLVPGHGVLSTGLRRREYNQLVRLLAYKLPWKGLPDPVKVSSVDIFITCPQCGLATKSNRLRSDFFICTRCGTAMETDKLGGVNLARKLIRYHQSKVKIKAERVEGGVRFTHRLMGLDIVAGNYENPLDKLKREIERILAAAAFESVAERGKKAIEGLEEQVSDEPDSHNRITHSVSGATADKDFCAIPESPLESVEKAHDVMDDQTLALRRSLFKKFMSVDNFMDLLEYV